MTRIRTFLFFCVLASSISTPITGQEDEYRLDFAAPHHHHHTTGAHLLVVETTEAVPTPFGECKNAGTDCYTYSDMACQGIYTHWARDHCALRCGFCTPATTMAVPTPTTENPTTKVCENELDNCDAYTDDECKGDYEEWARANCALRCGYCQGHTYAVPTIPVTTVTLECVDKLPDCHSYTDPECVGEFEEWAREKCALRCGYCNGTTIAVPTIPSTTHLEICEDKATDCYSLQDSECIGVYTAWSKEYCALRCGYCNGTKLIVPTVPATTVKEDCVDKVSNCHEYVDQECVGLYETWAKDYCPLRCGYCNGTSMVIPTIPVTVTPQVCKNVLVNCDAYTDPECIGEFEAWGRTNCALRCGYCSIGIKILTDKTSEATKSTAKTTFAVPTIPPSTTESTTFAVPTIPNTTPEEVCVDNKDDCSLYSPASCGGIFTSWAKKNCALRCGFCTTTSIAVPTIPTTHTTEICEDKLSDCASYTQQQCSGSFETWARANCGLRCGYCTSTKMVAVASTESKTDKTTFVVPTLPPTASTATKMAAVTSTDSKTEKSTSAVPTRPPTASTATCTDKSPDCVHYTDTDCQGNLAWVAVHCAARCKLCSTHVQLMG